MKMIVLVLLIIFLLIAREGGNELIIAEISYIGKNSAVFSKFPIKCENCKTVKKISKNTIIIDEKEPAGKIQFSYGILIWGGQFVKYFYPEVKKFKSNIPPDNIYNPLNPAMIIQEYEGYNVVMDDLLPGGTKQRGLFKYVKGALDAGIKSIAYGGPAQGIAQAGLGMTARYYGFEAHMFYSGKRSILSKFAEDIGVIMHPIEGTLIECQKAADEWGAGDKTRLVLPFGLDDPEFKKCLIGALKQVAPPIDVKHMWVVGGSGVLLNCLYHVFPTAFFHVIQVGRSIWPDMIDATRTQIFVHPMKFPEFAEELPPYKSIGNYDAKVWHFAKKYGRPGDYIWNVAG